MYMSEWPAKMARGNSSLTGFVGSRETESSRRGPSSPAKKSIAHEPSTGKDSCATPSSAVSK